jgi:hypothetical protein
MSRLGVIDFSDVVPYKLSYRSRGHSYDCYKSIIGLLVHGSWIAGLCDRPDTARPNAARRDGGDRTRHCGCGFSRGCGSSKECHHNGENGYIAGRGHARSSENASNRALQAGRKKGRNVLLPLRTPVGKPVRELCVRHAPGHSAVDRRKSGTRELDAARRVLGSSGSLAPKAQPRSGNLNQQLKATVMRSPSPS